MTSFCRKISDGYGVVTNEILVRTLAYDRDMKLINKWGAIDITEFEVAIIGNGIFIKHLESLNYFLIINLKECDDKIKELIRARVRFLLHSCRWAETLKECLNDKQIKELQNLFVKNME